MIYYKIKPEFDQKRRIKKNGKTHSILIGGELYTEKEKEKYIIPAAAVDIVNIPKNKTFSMFGARFECKTQK